MSLAFVRGIHRWPVNSPRKGPITRKMFPCARMVPSGCFRKLSWDMMTSSNGNIFRVTGPLCGEFTGPCEFPAQRPVTRSFDVFLDLRLNKRLSKQPWSWWFETPSNPLRRHSNIWSRCYLPGGETHGSNDTGHLFTKRTPSYGYRNPIINLRSDDRLKFIVRRVGLIWSQQDFEWWWSVPLSSASLY